MMDKPCPPDGPGRGAGILNMFDMVTKALPAKLELTPEQKEKFNTLVAKNRAELEEIVKKLDAQRDKFDTDLNAILTPEQKTKLQELKARKEKMMEGRGPGMMGEGRGPGMGMARPGVMLKAINELNLPEEKAAKAKDIVNKSKESFKNAPQGDKQARMQIMKNTMTQLKEVLTPEEMDQLKAKMREMRPAGPKGERGQMGPGRHHGGMRGPGKGMGPKNCPATTAPAE
jgi:Spy/CpxP family protein refolding chaperone